MSKPFYVSLPARGAVRIEGEDRSSFLQGLVSNDVSKASAEQSVYACLLTPQGKFLHDFFIHDDGGALLLDCEGSDRAHDLHERLGKYRLRAKIGLSVEPIREIYAVIGAPYGLADPRHDALGHRSAERPDCDKGDFADYDRLRISLRVPDGSRDMEIERSTLLECGIDRLHGIDWDKGCYMGQELTARTHYRGLVKKHLYAVRIDSAAPAPFSDLPHGGSMRSSCGDIGLALLRDEMAGADYPGLTVMQ